MAAKLLPLPDLASAGDRYDVLGCFATHLGLALAGEVANAKLLYLIGTSRLFPKPMHAVIKGPSAAGKSELRKQVLRYFPADEIINFTTMSEKALLHEPQALSHKILSMDEALNGKGHAIQDYYLREMMSAGRITHKVTMQGFGFPQTMTIVVEGPVSFWVTTTKDKLHHENETRMLSLRVSEDEEQTRAILRKIAEQYGPRKPEVSDQEIALWHRFQRGLMSGERRVVIPFASVLAELIPPRAVRLRRDFPQLLTAIKSHALLHNEWRDADDDGIHANLRDYSVVRSLMVDIMADPSATKLTAEMRETIEAVKALQPCTAQQVARWLDLDTSSAHRRLRAAIMKGLVENRQQRARQPGGYHLAAGAADKDMLPPVEALEAGWP